MLKINITKEIGDFKLALDVEITPAFTALFGPSGAGKTTTLNLIAGLSQPAQGEIALNNRLLFSGKRKINIRPQQRHIGYIFQESRLFPHLSVKNNLLFGYRKVPETDRRFQFEDIVAVTDVEHLLDRTPRYLSGGEKQRVALARALLASPEYLLMDEPLAALDLPTRLSFLNYLKRIHRDINIPILYISHDLANVLNFADDVIILKNGQKTGYGSPYALLDKMSAPPLVSQEDVPNIFEAEVLAHQEGEGLTIVKLGVLNIVLPKLHCRGGEKLLLNIPASEILLSREKPQSLSASNIFKGVITGIHQINGRVLVDVDVGMHFTVEIIPATINRLGLQKDEPIFLIIKASSFRKLA